MQLHVVTRCLQSCILQVVGQQSIDEVAYECKIQLGSGLIGTQLMQAVLAELGSHKPQAVFHTDFHRPPKTSTDYRLLH